MKRKRMRVVVILAFCAALLCSALAFADENSMGKCYKMGMADKMWSKMDLDEIFFYKIYFILANAAEIGITDEQVEKIKTIKYQTKKNLIMTGADIEVLALDIREKLGKDEMDIDAINSLIDEKYTLKAQKAKAVIMACDEMKNVLTKDQQKKLKTMWCEAMSQKMECMMQGKGKMYKMDMGWE